jgi:hypothetical protein
MGETSSLFNAILRPENQVFDVFQDLSRAASFALDAMGCAGLRIILADGNHFEFGVVPPEEQPITSNLVCGGNTLGRLELLGQSPIFSAEESNALATFLAAQLALIVARSQSAELNADLRLEVAALQQELLTQKLFERARGIIARERKLSMDDAGAWLREQSLRLRQPVWQVADSLITARRLTLPTRRTA